MTEQLAPPVHIDFVRGDASGLSIPAHPEALLAAGPAFLTRAFRAWGMLDADNAVARIVEAVPCPEGNSGEKLFLTVTYDRNEPGLDTRLFVKFSRCFPDVFRDRRKFELFPEIRLAELSRLPAFPVAVAKAWFADFEQASGTGMLITRRIAFGEDGVLPIHRKCMDLVLEAPLDHYRATLTALARLAGAHKAGRLSPELERLFPYDREAAAAEVPMPWNEASLRDAMGRMRDFARTCPRLLPEPVRAPAFLDRLEVDSALFMRHDAAIRRFLFSQNDFIALHHWNTHLDNAWFWRDTAGTMQCGLLDWGMARHMHAAVAIWGGVSCAQPDFLAAHLDDLIAHYGRELAESGGPKLDRDELALQFDVAVGSVGLAMMMDLPRLVLGRQPNLAAATGPDDPMVVHDQVIHGFHYATRNFLSVWERRDFGTSLRRLLQRRIS